MMTQHACEPEVGDARGEAAVYQNVALCAISRRKMFEQLNIRFSDLHARTASHGGISVHERHLLAVEMGFSIYSGFREECLQVLADWFQGVQ